MNADYLSHKRATSVSLLGMVLQVILGVTTLIYSVYAKDHAGFTAALYILLGVPVWVCLAIVYDAHRRERIEEMEARSLDAGGGVASSVFQDSGDVLRVASRRLKSIHRFFVPGIGLLVAGGLIAVGMWRFSSGRGRVSLDTFHPITNHGWPIGIGIGLAVIAFMLARYVSGMAMQRVWKSLRGGATFAVGSALFGLAIAVAHFIDIPGPDAPVRYLQVLFPIAMILLGVEVCLNFLIDIYRPRKAGEAPRPAFDSRVLGFVAAPDQVAKSIGEALNYQFGFDVASSWFYRLLSRWIAALVGIGVLVMWLTTALAVVQPHQRGMVLRFGEIVRPDIGPGLHLKMPWPIDRVAVPEHGVKDERTTAYRMVSQTATGVREIHIGSSPAKDDGPILWTNEHAAKETYLLVQPPAGEQIAGATSASGDPGTGKDLSLVAVEIPLHFVVRDVLRFEEIAPPDQRDDLLRAVAQREATMYLLSLPEDQVLAGERGQIASELRTRIQAAFNAMNRGPDGQPRGAGVELIFVGVSGVHPPKEVAPNFEFVIQAEAKQAGLMQTAEADAIARLTRVVGDASRANDIVRELDVLEAMKNRRFVPGSRESGELDAGIAEQEAKIERLLAEASGRAGATILRAKADRWSRHMGARSRATRYAGELDTYRASAEIQRASLYFDALSEAIRGTRLYVLPGAVPARIQLDFHDRDTGLDVFRPNADEDNSASR